MKDYTKISIGTEVDGGVIAICPKCEKLGLQEQNGDMTFYTHLQGFVPKADGTFEGKWDWHAFSTKESKKSNT